MQDLNILQSVVSPLIVTVNVPCIAGVALVILSTDIEADPPFRVEVTWVEGCVLLPVS